MEARDAPDIAELCGMGSGLAGKADLAWQVVHENGILAGAVMIVIKIGGSIFGKEEKILADVAKLGEQVVLVHGAAETSNVMKQMGMEVEYITSPEGFKSRRTTREVMDVYLMACGGKMNKWIVARLQKAGVNAVGLSGVDGRTVQARRKILTNIVDGKAKIVRDDYTG